ncbi:type VII secretion protein EccB [Mycobacterium sp. shizuoka-1]|uniref:type VII secretion protein EccB n=1 Tax=Mycobacterium sp. shizuoka-1 TaxID=2039281 RepID=UPI000C05D292|nr:type VII secretion protein EccB [Mycobacterium sp. shizuoka-1]GAY14944.1 type VII secretion protein EccB [Mycobacterium sp. shizuoka-1]
MTARPPLRAQWSADRFLLRRLDYAVSGRSMPLRRDPLRARKSALLAGCVVAAAMAVLDTALGSSGPGALPADADLVMSRQSGALFVRVDDRLRAVANLTSARLILGSPATPRLVDDTALAGVPDGPVLGIPGAPHALGVVTAAAGVHWAVCDDAAGNTTVAVGGDGVPGTLGPRAAVVAAVSHGDGARYLLYDGTRALIDLGDPATTRALRLGDVAVRSVSPTVLNTIAEVPAITPPRIPERGHPSAVTGLTVGTVVRVSRADSREYYVVLGGGLQRVGQLTVDLVRFADSAAPAEILEVPPEVIARSPLVDVLPVATFPDEPPALVDVDGDLCATWQSGRIDIAVGAPSPAGPGLVTLAGADGDGPGVDMVRLNPGRSLDVSDPTGAGRYLVTSAGVRFPVDDSAASALGATGTPAVGPWPIVSALPAGPELSRAAALVGRDVVGPAP